MRRTRIKICGITRPEDALAAVECGADALGLVFYPSSPRAVTLEQAKAIAAVMPPFVTLVALFVDETAEAIAGLVSRLPVGLLQFHGDEPPGFCAQFQRPWVKALRCGPGIDIAGVCSAYSGACGILLDAWQEGVPGGTGRTFDWSLVPRDMRLPLVLAGGLNADNVGDALAALEPWAVDVSGGVESAPGIKDVEKMQQFVAAVRAADRHRVSDQTGTE